MMRFFVIYYRSPQYTKDDCLPCAAQQKGGVAEEVETEDQKASPNLDNGQTSVYISIGLPICHLYLCLVPRAGTLHSSI